jgi:hypothetical protein
MNRTAHALMVLLFAFLQCLAPVVHAHIDGNNQHASATQTAPQPNIHSVELNTYLEETESATISIANEFQRETSSALTEHRTIKSRLPSPATAILSNQFICTEAYFFDTQHYSPPRQAPPV